VCRIDVLEADYECFCVDDSFNASDTVGNEVSHFLGCFCLDHYRKVVASENSVDFFDAFDFADLLFESLHKI